MPRASAEWRAAVAPIAQAVLLAVSVLWIWGLIVAPRAPASSPIRFVRDSLLPLVPAAPLPASKPPGRVRLGFVGDIMQHAGQGGGSRNFAASYAELAPWLRGFDLLIGNLEFPVDSTRPAGPRRGTTRFNGSPAHLDALVDAGFDLLGTANNHAFDQGRSGMERTLRAITRRGLVAVGTWTGAEAPLVLRDVGGIRVAVEAYTLPLNAYRDSSGAWEWAPRDLPITVLGFGAWEAEFRAQGVSRFRERAALARRSGADVIVAFVHWGDEWRFGPTADQRTAARDLIDAGFDLVVGSHGHVLNGAELYRGKLIAYSLGNFVSDFRPLEARTGAVLEVELGRDRDGNRVTMAGYSFHPIVTVGRKHLVTPASPDAGGDARAAWTLARSLLGDVATLSRSTREQ